VSHGLHVESYELNAQTGEMHPVETPAEFHWKRQVREVEWWRRHTWQKRQHALRAKAADRRLTRKTAMTRWREHVELMGQYQSFYGWNGSHVQ
jgi:hypothetical protein